MKNTVRLTTFAVLLLATLFAWSTPVAHAQELTNASSFKHLAGSTNTVIQPGVYELKTQKPLNSLLMPVNPERRWNVVYQQNTAMPMITPVQYHSDLHVFIAASDLAVASDTTKATVEPTEETATSSAVLTAVKAVATPTPTPTAITISKTEPVVKTKVAAAPTVQLAPSELDGLFEKYGAEYGVSASVLKHIAKCESGLNPAALSRNGLYGGLFQFVSSTWVSNRKAMGLDSNPELRFNAEEAIRTAAFKISKGGIGAWPVCGKKATASVAAAI